MCPSGNSAYPFAQCLTSLDDQSSKPLFCLDGSWIYIFGLFVGVDKDGHPLGSDFLP